VDYILTDQPETPFSFAVMKRVNKMGPPLTHALPPVKAINPSKLAATAAEALIIDASSIGEFAQAHVPSTINVPASNLVQWAGFFVDYDRPVYLITDEASLAAQVRSFRSIGIDNVGGYFDANAVKSAGLRTETYQSATPAQLRGKIEGGEVTLVDVRAATEFHAGHIASAEHRFLGTLLRNIESLDRDKPVVAQCLAGGRSAIAASIFQRAGFEVVNMQGGIQAWANAGLPVEREEVATVG
jgi:hydroxyacylglutathione hydrolase